MDTTTSQEPSNVSTPANENDIIHSEPSSQHSPKEAPTPTRPLKIYTRAQILALQKSPLVSVPNGMPELKDWFGTENEQNLSRKDSEPSTPNSGRERRFRRDIEDGDLPPRPSFRSTASQPSQMGNFKHQSLRSSDRDLDRDREGERLRNLSDKFDRDRLSISGLRNKERDVAPHFSTGSSRGTTQQGTIAARRLEGRDGTRKEDWRRGNDSRRSERSEITRDERDPRRDSSRTRRDPSSSRRDLDTRRERDRDREEYRRERDRDEPRRDRDDIEPDDPKKWREEGRRDTRRDRGRDKPSHENSWENGDRRWGLAEDKKRGTARDKKSTATDDREERRSEREKEKEPAWMDTYIPSSSGGGILGGKGSDGELDGIQAWKKNMKEKEQQAQKALKPVDQDASGVTEQREEEQMDEIQRFKKLMELAQKQKGSQTESLAANSSTSAANPSADTTSSGGRKLQEDVPILKTSPTPATDPSQPLLSLFTSTDVSRASSQPTPNSTISNNSNSISKPPSKPTDTPLAVERTSDNAPTSSIASTAQGSRLLALGSRAPIKPQLNSQSSLPNGTTFPLAEPVHKASSPTIPIGSVQVVPKVPSRASFTPFEEQREHGETRRVSGERPSPSEAVGWPESSNFDHPTSGHSVGKGSRFAKFFDAKAKETSVQPPSLPKSTTPVGFVSSSPIPSQRQDAGFNSVNSPNGDENVTVEDLFAKLSMNTQLQSQRSNPPHSAQVSSLGFGQQAHNIQHFHQQQQLQSQHLHQHHNTRLETFTESRNFTPDGLVPGLRSVPPPRTRDNGMFQDPLDEAVLLNAQQRLALQQQRGFDQLYPGSLSTGFGQQGNRNVGLSLQQQQFRGGPSPTLQGQHVPLQQQRLPPGLANLGGRPPHDPTQLLGLQGGLGSQLHGGLQVNPQQQGFSNFHPQPTNVGFGGPQPQLRGPLPGSAHTLPAHQLGGLGLPGGLDLRNANQQQSQLLAMNGLGGGALRGVGNNGYNPVSSSQLQNPLLAQMRQQQQPPPQIPPHMIPHMMPPHLQQPGPVTSNQSAQDLMALLMGGVHHRE